MAFRLSAHHLEDIPGSRDESDCSEDASSSSEEDEGDLTWEDWVSDSLEKQPCKSLFDETVKPSVAETLEHDKTNHGFDLRETVSRLELDTHQQLRLVNWIRKEKPNPPEVKSLKGDEPFLRSDEYLIPVVEDDPLLQIDNDDWSDEEEEVERGADPSDMKEAAKKIKLLEKKLQKAQQNLKDYRSFVGDRLNLAGLADALKDHGESSTHVAVPLRDDDSHYFQSYGENDIHSVMIQDKVRTATYASFILQHPEIFRGATVLDVGCGTGILSLFAAKSGAKRVFAVDASDISEKAEKIVKENGFENVITVIRGKIEEIKLPDDITHVDIIVSEWMGYGLLYESMLDSVLHARDRFLRPGSGILAPSQTQMMFGLCKASDIFKERVGFWSDVYGFDLSAMAANVYEDAIVDVVGPETLASEPFVIKDLYLRDITIKQLDFSSSFTLVSTTERRTKVNAFVLYFDTFFTTNGAPIPEGTEAYIVREGDPVLAEVWQVGRPHTARRMSSGDPLKRSKPKITSFSTGPLSVPTHWKQTLFLLREPIVVEEGTVVQGQFKLRKSPENSRELDVEIHYTTKDSLESTESGQTIIQLFKVR